MNLAITLLMTALSLLTQLSRTPNVSPDLRAQVESVSQYAISFAQKVIDSNQSIPQIPSVEVKPVSTDETIVDPQNPTCTITAVASDDGPNPTGTIAWSSNTKRDPTIYIGNGSTSAGHDMYFYYFSTQTPGTMTDVKMNGRILRVKADYGITSCTASLN